MRNRLLLFLFCVSMSTVKSAVWTVSNNPASPAQFTTLQGGLDAANPGDTVYVSGSSQSYSQSVLRKRLTIIGPGFGPGAVEAASIWLGMDTVPNVSGGSGSHFIGLRFVANFSINDHVHDLLIERCDLACEFLFGLYAAGWEIRHCYVREIWSVGSNLAVGMDFHHNIFYTGASIFSSPSLGGMDLRNNLFLGDGTLRYAITFSSNIVVENNCFWGVIPARSDVTECVFNNNLTFETLADTLPPADNTGENNLIGVDPQFVYAPDWTSNYTYDYHLQSSSPGFEYGTDSTDIGIFGGENPMPERAYLPVLPAVVQLVVASPVIGPGELLMLNAQLGHVGGIAEAEYFIDADPGVGSGMPLSGPFGTDTVWLPCALDMDALSLGEHIISIRGRSATGEWGITTSRPFVRCEVVAVHASFTAIPSGLAVSFVNNTVGETERLWQFDDGNTSELPSPVHEFNTPGVYEVCLTSYNPCTPQGDSTCHTISINGISSVVPRDLSNVGAYAVMITGSGFLDHDAVWLEQEGSPDLVADTVEVINDRLMKAWFVFDGAATGFRKVLVALQNGDTLARVDGVRLWDPELPKLTVGITGPAILRVGFSQVYTVTVRNTGYADAYLPIVLLDGLPLGTTFEFTDSLYGGESISAFDTLGIDWYATRALHFTDSITMTGLFPLLVHRVPANGSISFGVIFHLPSDSPLHAYHDIRASVSGPMYSSLDLDGARNLSYDCFSSATSLVLNLMLTYSGASDWVECVGGIAGIANTVFHNLTDDAETHPPDKPSLWGLPGIASGIVSTASSCAVAAGSIVAPFNLGMMVVRYRKILFGLETAATLHDAYASGISIGETCFNGGPLEIVSSKFQKTIIGNATDPNAKWGPGGSNAAHWVQRGEPFTYTIGFENLPEALLPAQVVLVTDTLDQSRLDLSTFGFEAVTVGDELIQLSGAPQAFVHTMNRRATMGCDVRITAWCDTTTGILSCLFNTVDTLTGQNTTEALAGFLPPDTAAPAGQGQITFTIRMKEEVAGGDTIQNRATIFFDTNAPITTNTWECVLDDIPPVSQVLGLPPSVLVDSVLVSWSGSDAISGLRYFSLYVQQGSDEYHPWQTGTTATESWYYGVPGNVYRFYSLATDSAGNVENAPEVADETIEFLDPTLVEEIRPDQVLQVLPNPSDGRFTLNSLTPFESQAVLRVVDVVGKEVLRYTLPSSVRSTTIVDLCSIPSGVYVVSVTGKSGTRSCRLVKN